MTDVTVLAPKITDTTAKGASAAVTQVVNADIDNLTAVVKLTTWTTNTLLIPTEVLEIQQLQVPQVPDR